jgi:very-short-patch-repair endonuclease
LVIEVAGVTHEGALQKAHDAKRTAFIESWGYVVVRFSNDDVLCRTADVSNCIKRMLVVRRAVAFSAAPIYLRA